MAILLLLLSLLFPNILLPSLPALAQPAPVNASASAEAVKVLRELNDMTGKRIITGQHDYLESPDEWNNRIRELTGQYAKIHGYELGPIMNQSERVASAQRQGVVNSAIAWHKSGGLVTFSYHESIPGMCRCWSNVKTAMSQEQFNKFVTPGTHENDLLIAELDKTASYLKQLKDAGVPVLWRPYHEMNGDWFWWGGKTNFTALWNLMYDRFVNVHQLDNLLWVWSPNAPNGTADAFEPYYPGDDKVDVLALDIYNNDYQQSYYDKLVALAQGKPIAIGENGELPGEDVLKAQPDWVYMMSWANLLTEKNSVQSIASFFAASRSVKKEDAAVP